MRCSPGRTHAGPRRPGALPVLLAVALTVHLTGLAAPPQVLVPVEFRTTTGNAGNSWTADVLNPPTGLSASRPCTPLAPTFVAASSAATTSTTVAVTKPTGTASGDLLLAFAYSSDNSDPPSPPSGWTEIESETVSSGLVGEVYQRTAGGSEPASYTFTGFDSSDEGAVVIVAYRDVHATTPVAAHSSAQGNSATVTAPSVSVGTANSVLVVGLMPDTTNSPGTPSGMTSLAVRGTATEGGISVAAEPRPSTGATGTRSISAASARWAAFSVVVAPGSAVDPTVTLNWTATPDTYATGYTLTRTPGGSSSIAGRTTVTSTDTTTSSGTGYTYALRSVASPWTSTAASVSVPAC